MSLQPGLVSIVTPAYNSEKLIAETIECVQAQSYSNWEMLIVMDKGTTDRTAEIVQSYSQKDPRIQLTHIKDQKGLALSRNRALQLAKGQYIAFLDSDDLWLPEKLKNQIEFMQKNKAAFSTHHFRRMSAEGHNIGKLLPVPEIIQYEDLLINNMIGCLTVMIDQSQTGRLQMQETKHEDFLLWLDVLKKGFPCYGLNQDLARYRIMPQSRSANKLEMIQYRWKILREFEHIGFLASLRLVFLYGMTSLKKYSRF